MKTKWVLCVGYQFIYLRKMDIRKKYILINENKTIILYTRTKAISEEGPGGLDGGYSLQYLCLIFSQIPKPKYNKITICIHVLDLT